MLNVFCYSAESLKLSAATVSGVEPITSPPSSLGTFDPKQLEGRDLIFFKLHGLAGQPYWYGDGAITAISAEQIQSVKLDGALVFAENCFGLESPMPQALLSAGAAAVVAGGGINLAGISVPGGADLIATWWRRLLEAGYTVDHALRAGKFLAFLAQPGLREDIQSFALVGNKSATLRRA